MRAVPPRRQRLHRRPTQAGFSLLEALFSASVLAVGLLTVAAATLGEHRHQRQETARGRALTAMEQFVESLHADEDWPGLYDRLAFRERMAKTEALADARLHDGRRTYLPSSYVPDVRRPDGLESFTVLIDVPSAPSAEGEDGEPVLREDVTNELFGLPTDLNGDGAIDATARDGDYAMLPVGVWFRWQCTGEGPQQLRLLVWLRGDR